MFILNENNNYTLVGHSSNSTVERLEKGVYNMQLPTMANPSFIFSKNEDYKKGTIVNHGIFKETREFLDNFFSESMVEARKLLGMKNKLGVMFNGSPGIGKTFYAGQVTQEICDKYDAIGILATITSDYSGVIDGIRSNDPDRKIILILDEFEKTFKRYDTDMLSFLSGAKERDNLIVIATVNDISELPSFIHDRPSRFERIFDFSFNDDIVLENIITTLIPDDYKSKLDSATLISKVREYKNMSIDRIRHIIRDVISAQIVFEKTGIMTDIVISNPPESKRAIGFLAPADEVIELSDLLSSEELSVDGMVDWRETQLN
jgi:hypothetical protein